MTSLVECERHVVEKLISVLTKALDCQFISGSEKFSEGEISVAENVLQVLVALNDTFLTGVRNLSEDISVTASQNLTDAISDGTGLILPELVQSDDGNSIITSSFGDDSTSKGISPSPSFTNDGGMDESFGTNKLHQLEIIKVFVLIFVISIILLTTCRMVFQLFIRFRPEKPPLA